MLKNILIDDPEIVFYTSQKDYAEAAKILLKQQKKIWLQLSDGYKSLETVKTKAFQFEGFKIKVQFNPGRIISSSAKVDSKSIKERKCFLCSENLPAEQKGILYKNDYLILCNPFPIFPEHFTLSNVKHIPQQIADSFESLLSFSKDLSKYYVVFYNGPKCGASAPDHLHFQAGNKFFMPLDNEFHLIKNEYGKILIDNDELILTAINDKLRKFISIESSDKEKIKNSFKKIYTAAKTFSSIDEEPMMNIISFYEEWEKSEEYKAGEKWRVLIFLREKHRPSHYFAKGDDNILLSPAAVDLGGVCITPLEKDFNKITKENIFEIFNEIFISDEKFDKIIKTISEILSSQKN